MLMAKDLYNKEFGDRLKQLRKSAGLTQSNVSKLFDIAFRTWQKYEAGVMYPSMSRLFLIADFWGISLDMLLRGKEFQYMPSKSLNTDRDAHRRCVGIPKAIFDDERITTYFELVVYIVLCNYTQFDDQGVIFCDVSNQKLMKLSRCSKSSVHRALKKLEELGYIKRMSSVGGRGCTCKYIIAKVKGDADAD